MEAFASGLRNSCWKLVISLSQTRPISQATLTNEKRVACLLLGDLGDDKIAFVPERQLDIGHQKQEI